MVLEPEQSPVEVDIPIEDPVQGVAFGNVNTTVYRANINGVRFTAHTDKMNGASWIVRHTDHRADSDGTPVARSALLYGAGALNAAWDGLRMRGAGNTD